MDTFQTCKEINQLLIENKEKEARNLLIKLLDYCTNENIAYDNLINQLIRDTGLYPYIDIETANWQTRFVYEAFKVDIGIEEPVTLHRAQSDLLKQIIDGKNIAVSAPTSFGKSFIIDAFISIKKPSNVLIIVPTIALTDETRRRLYKKFSKEYKIITTTEAPLSEKNIFIFPQERAISYVNKINELDLLIVDEFYKASYNFDSERSPSLIKAILKLGRIAKQKYFLAPNISSISNNPFTQDMNFCEYNFNTVFLEKYEDYKNINKDERLKSDRLLEILNSKKTKTLIYAGTYSNIDKVSTLLLNDYQVTENAILNQFSDWLGNHYAYNWSLTKLVKKGIGVHNGNLHRSLSQIQIKLFEEDEGLNTIISTSSIIEGVNTSAENVIIWANRSGNRQAKLNDFTYKNIIGRGGRMFKHFIGKIYILEEPPIETDTQLDIPFPEVILGDLDEKLFEKELTQEQIAKIILYKKEMYEILGEEEFNIILNENIFQTNDTELLKMIALDMKKTPENWYGLSYLNSRDRDNWNNLLLKILYLQSSRWGYPFEPLINFIKILYDNWKKSIPELLNDLEPYNIGINDFFKLEKIVTYKLSSLLSDVNILQGILLKEKNYKIGKFINWVSNAFLPNVVFQLEEFGLPRMISKKIHNANIINFLEEELTIHIVLEKFNELGYNKIASIDTLSEFDKYIIRYFFDGIESK